MFGSCKVGRKLLKLNVADLQKIAGFFQKRKIFCKININVIKILMFEGAMPLLIPNSGKAASIICKNILKNEGATQNSRKLNNFGPRAFIF